MYISGSEPRPTILAVACTPSCLAALAGDLSRLKYAPVTAQSARQALDVVGKHSPDLIIIDPTDGVPEHMRFCAQIKGTPFTWHIPILALVARASPERLEWYRKGARVVQTPYELGILDAQIIAAMRRSFCLDPLTHFPTAGYLHGQLDVWLANGAPTAVLYADIDNFRAFAASYGQDAANKVIIRLARLIAGVLPRDDVALAYMGGDRFMAILPPDGADTIAGTLIQEFRRIRDEFYEPPKHEPLHSQSSGTQGRVKRAKPLTLSAALISSKKATLTNYVQVSATVSELIRRAKERGGDQVVMQ